MENFSQYVSTMDEFKKQIEEDKTIKNESHEQKVMRVRKNLVLSFPSDASGVGHIRNIQIFTYLNAIFGKTRQLHPAILPFFVFQPEVLIYTRSIFFQRVMNPEQVQIIAKYKELQTQFKYKMIYDIDDFIFKGDEEGEDIPDYNFGKKTINDDIRKSAVDIMNMMDTVCVSTQFLGDYLKNRAGVTSEIKVVQNTVPMYFFGSDSRKPITEKIKKPRVVWTGSPTHYNDKEKLKGDMDNAWCDWVIKSVKENKIDFLLMGAHKIPFFFEELQGLENFKIVRWVNSYQYILTLMSFKPDIGIMPLVPNFFNYSKSCIKFLEYAAGGICGIGTSPFSTGFPSPYDICFHKLPDTCSVEDIEKLVDYVCEPDIFNDTIKKQYQYLRDNNHYLESQGFINYFCSII